MTNEMMAVVTLLTGADDEMMVVVTLLTGADDEMMVVVTLLTGTDESWASLTPRSGGDMFVKCRAVVRSITSTIPVSSYTT